MAPKLFNLFSIVILLVSSVDSSAVLISSSTPVSCARFFEPDYTIDSLFPEVGPGFFERFPYHLLPIPAAIQEMLRTPPDVIQDNDPNPSSLLFSERPSGFLSALKEKLELFSRSHPEWARVRIEVRNIKEFMPESTVNEAEMPEESSPLNLLPREWQVHLLMQLLEKKPELKYTHRFERMVKMATNTNFSLRGEKPRQPLPPRPPRTLENRAPGFLLIPGNFEPQYQWTNGYDGNLDPGFRAAEVLRRFRQHYFGDQLIIDPDEYKAALRMHLYFRLR